LNDTFSSRSRLGWPIAVLTVVIGATGVFAAESEGKHVPVTRAPENDAISATKRGFETINSSRDPTLQQKGDVPRFTVPEMPATSGSSWTPPKANTPEKKSANWLVDAMEKPADERKRATRGQGEHELDRARDAIGRTSVDAMKDEMKPRPDAEPSEGRDNERKSTTTVVANPLNHYLGEWMTPQDYSLLKPGLAQSAIAGPGGRDSTLLPTIQIPGGKLLPGMDTTSGLMSTPAPLLGHPPTSKANPYLEPLNAPMVMNAQPVYALPVPILPSPPKTSLNAVAPPPPVVEPAKSKVPEFAKPAQDEKYFKQLKRF
jgi:hypothetical protein